MKQSRFKLFMTLGLLLTLGAGLGGSFYFFYSSDYLPTVSKLSKESESVKDNIRSLGENIKELEKALDGIDTVFRKYSTQLGPIKIELDKIRGDIFQISQDMEMIKVNRKKQVSVSIGAQIPPAQDQGVELPAGP